MPDDIGNLGVDITNFQKDIDESIKTLAKFDQAISETNKKLKDIDQQLKRRGGMSTSQERELRQEQLQNRELLAVLQKKRREYDEGSKSQDRATVASEKTADTVSKLEKAATTLRSVFSVLGLSVGIGAIISFGKSLLEFGRNISVSARESDLSTTAYQRTVDTLMHFRIAGKDAESAVQSVANTLRAAKNDAPDAVEKFDELGISFKELKDPATTAETVISKLADGYVAAGDKQEYLRRAGNAFGDDIVRRMIPALNQGGKAIDDYKSKLTVPPSAATSAAEKGSSFLENTYQKLKERLLVAAAAAQEVNEKHPILGKIPFIAPFLIGPKVAATYGDKVPGTNIKFPSKMAVGESPATQNQLPAPSTAPTLAVTQSAKTAAQTKKTLDNSFQIAIDLNNAESKRGFTLRSQLEVLEAQRKSIDRRLKLPEVAANKLVSSELRKQLNDISLQTGDIEFQYGIELARARTQTNAMDALQRGQSMLASIEKLRLEYAEKIAQAQREGKGALVGQLQAQMELDKRATIAQFGMRTPAQRHAELVGEQGFNVAVNRGQARIGELASREARGIKLSRAQQRELGAYQKMQEPSTGDLANTFYKDGLLELKGINGNTKEITGNAP